MNYLQLVQRVKRESGLAGAGPTTVTAAVGDTARLCDWIRDAWQDIQMLPKRNWKWMRGALLGTVSVAGGMSYNVNDPAVNITRFSRWKAESDDYWMSAYEPSNPASEWRLRQLGYDVFRSRFMLGQHEAAPPQYWAEGPGGELLIGPTPNATYKVRGSYYLSPQTLLEDDDTPEAPVEFHMAIVWRALNEYGAYDAAPEVVARAARNYTEFETRLAADQADPIVIAALPLV